MNRAEAQELPPQAEAKHIQEFKPEAVLAREKDLLDARLRQLQKDLTPTIEVADVGRVDKRFASIREQIALVQQERQYLLDLSAAIIVNRDNPEETKRLFRSVGEYFDKKSAESAKKLQALWERNKKEEGSNSTAVQEYVKLKKIKEDSLTINATQVAIMANKAMAQTGYGMRLGEAEKESTELQRYQDIALEFKRRSAGESV